MITVVGYLALSNQSQEGLSMLVISFAILVILDNVDVIELDNLRTVIM